MLFNRSKCYGEQNPATERMAKMALLNHVRITGLHGKRDVEIPFRTKNCIMIGPNGTGKSTVLQIVAYSLGRQWQALSALSFDSVHLSFDSGIEASLTKAACELFGKFRRRRGYRPFAYDAALMESLVSLDPGDNEQLVLWSNRLEIPPLELKRMQRELVADPQGKAAQRAVRQFGEALEEAQQPPLVYLPTYRRIELELRQLMDQVPEPYRRSVEAKEPGRSDEFITEIIRFGMDDVAARFREFEVTSRDFARNKFNRMMASYIKEMANSEVISVKELRDLNISPSEIDMTLSRIEEGLLDQSEKENITDILLALMEGSAGGHPPFYKKWLAHFFVKLHNVHNEITSVELPVMELLDTLNRYLAPKRVRYDIENYHITIRDEFDRELTLQDLSSGEKQIVSIMSELYFRRTDFNIFIDEPELSLSVPWQVGFLEDIQRSPHCRQIIAVTHSPFIYDNTLSTSVVDFSTIY
jgi:predicted ATPase